MADGGDRWTGKAWRGRSWRGPVVFVSDLGLRDEFVGVCHLVIARIAPDVRVVDLSHGVPPHDIQAGAMMLANGLRFTPARRGRAGDRRPGRGHGAQGDRGADRRRAATWSARTTGCCRWRGGRWAACPAVVKIDPAAR